MKTIAAVAQEILSAPPVPVVMIDTCSLLDLFRRDDTTKLPRVPSEEIQAAADLLHARQNAAVHLVVPELSPREFADNAPAIRAVFDKWIASHDERGERIADALDIVGVPSARPTAVHPLCLPDRL